MTDFALIAVGVKSKVGNEHILMLDYDGLTQDEVIADIRKLQEEFWLPNVHLLMTSKGYHAVCLEMMPWEFVKKVHEASREDVRHHTILPNHTVLRLSGKYDKKTGEQVTNPPTYLKTIISRYPHKYVSFAHSQLYTSLFGVPPVSRVVRKGSIELVCYGTGGKNAKN